MNVKKIDLIWAAVSMFIVGYSYYNGRLLFGIVIIYLLMAAVFVSHIIRIRRSLRNNVTVYGTVSDYFIDKKGSHFYPILKYTTEEGREVTSAYTVSDKKKRYESLLSICFTYMKLLVLRKHKQSSLEKDEPPDDYSFCVFCDFCVR